MAQVDISPEASTTIQAMWEEVVKVEREFGSDNIQTHITTRSFAAAMHSMCRLGGRIVKDGMFGDLSLMGNNEYDFVYGINWDPHSRTWSVNS